MRLSLSAVALPVWLTATVGCGAGDPPAVRVERADSAGVAIVRNLGGDVPLDWTFEQRLSLGGADAGPESFFRVGPNTVDVDSAGNLYVLDWSNHRIVAFDSTGTHLRSFGREGGGPGEIERTAGMLVHPDGAVAVYDFAKSAFVRYAADGTPLEDRRIEEPFFGGEMGLSSAGPVLSIMNISSERLVVFGAEQPMEIARVEWTPPSREPVRFPNCPITVNFPPLYRPDLVWAARGARLVVSAGNGYAVDVYGIDGRLLESFRRPFDPIEATIERAAVDQAERHRTDAWRITGGDARCEVPWSDYVEARGIAEAMPVIHTLAIAPDGAIWVRRRLPEAGTRIDIIAPDGEYLGTLPAFTPFPIAFMPDGDIVAIERGALDIERLAVYDIVRSEAT